MPLPGKDSSRSLKRLFVDAGLSVREREETPVIYVGGRPAAALFVGVDRAFAEKERDVYKRQVLPEPVYFYTKQKGSLSSAGKVLPDMMNSRAEVFERYRKLYQTAKPHSRNTIAPLGYWVSVPMDGGYSVDGYRCLLYTSGDWLRNMPWVRLSKGIQKRSCLLYTSHCGRIRQR